MRIEQLLGGAVTLLFLADIFLTVLYARAGVGLLAPWWNRLVWRMLRLVLGGTGRRRGARMTLVGPIIVVALVLFWAAGLTIGAALVIQPELGRGIRPSSGAATTDFVTALMVAGNSLSILGSGDYAPHTTGTRLLFLFNSLVGASVLTLVLSYLVQVYSALRERNALALQVDLLTDGTGDAAVMLARILPGGDASNAASTLGNLVAPLAATKEAHHFYPLLFYFRFEDPRYAVSRLSLVLLDATSLIEAALDRQRYRPLTGSASVAALKRGAGMILDTLATHFPTTRDPRDDAAETWRFRQSYLEATPRLAAEHVAVRTDGVETYVASRRGWDHLVRRLAPTLGYAVDDIDRRHVAAADRDHPTPTTSSDRRLA